MEPRDFFSVCVLPQLMSWDNDKQIESTEFGVRKWQTHNKWNTFRITPDSTYWGTQYVDYSNMPPTWHPLRTKLDTKWETFVKENWPTAAKRKEVTIMVYARTYNPLHYMYGLAYRPFAN